MKKEKNDEYWYRHGGQIVITMQQMTAMITTVITPWKARMIKTVATAMATVMGVAFFDILWQTAACSTNSMESEDNQNDGNGNGGDMGGIF